MLFVPGPTFVTSLLAEWVKSWLNMININTKKKEKKGASRVGLYVCVCVWGGS